MIKNQVKQYTVNKIQIKITKQVIKKKQKQNQCHSTLAQLRNNLSETSKRLLDVSIEKGLSNWLTALLISDFSNIFGMQFAYDMDRVLQIYQQHAPVVVDVVYNIA